MTCILVAAIGNIFFRDDGFGPAVAAVLQRTPQPAGVRVTDYGIRGLHLAYDLLNEVDALVLIDAVPSVPEPSATTPGSTAARPPGSVTVMQIGSADLGHGELDAHGMSPVAVLASLGSLGGELPSPTYLVGCVPADISEGIGLSAPVAAAVGIAAGAVTDLVRPLIAAPAETVVH